MIVAFSSVAGAPGVSSWSSLFAAAWPTEAGVERVVVEADIDGGVAGARFGVGVSPGLLQMLSGVRDGGLLPPDIAGFARRVSELGWVVPAPESSEQCASLLSSAGAGLHLATAMASDDRLWVVDVGRAGAHDYQAPILRAAAMVYVLCRGDHSAVVQVPSRVAALREAGCSVTVLVAGKVAFPLQEMIDACGCPVEAVPAHRSLVLLASHVWSSRRVRRSGCWRRAVEIASKLSDALMIRSGAMDAPVEHEEVQGG